jgi:glycosyltransferase involved in cell wall biosynthesis
MPPSPKAPRALLLLTEVFANGGIQRFNQTLLSALIELHVQCEVLSLHDTPASIASQNLPPTVRATGYSGRRPRFSLAIARAACARRYDWVLIGHVNLVSMTVATLGAMPWVRARTLLIAHGIEVWYRIGWARKVALGRLSRILCVSSYTRERILAQVPWLDPARLLVFPNALGQTWSNRPAQPSRPTPVGARFILSVTRLHPGDRYKGVITVLEALSMLEDRDLEYVIVGQGSDRPFLQGVAMRLGIAHRVHFLSGVGDQELVDLYGRCQAFVLPSGKEGFGIVFLEAMFFGAPVIAAAEKGALDVIKNGESGLLVRFGDTLGLKRAIERLAGDDILRDHLREVGRSLVSAGGPFTYRRFVDRSAAALDIHPAPAT